MRWEAITPENAVERLRVASEHAICDFKTLYDFKTDPTKSFEIAKDVCAFANHLGGTILVGVHEGKGPRRGMIDAFNPLAVPSPGELVKEVDRAVRLYCLPIPVANAITIELDAGQVKAILGRDEPATTIVAINVQPTLSGPVGCRACSDSCKSCRDAGSQCTCAGKEVPDAWRFPIRVIEGTDLLRPDQIASRMNISERRALLELQRIPAGEHIEFWFTYGHSVSGEIERLDENAMICVILGHIDDGADPDLEVGYPEAEVPLTFVRHVWRTTRWNILIDGSAFVGIDSGRSGYAPPGVRPGARIAPPWSD